jgi:hypothetical protein
MPINGCGQHPTIIVIYMLTDEVDSPRCLDQPFRLSTIVLTKTLDASLPGNRVKSRLGLGIA